MHWPLDDPARVQGSEEHIMAVFRATRDDIQQRVRALLAELAQPAADDCNKYVIKCS